VYLEVEPLFEERLEHRTNHPVDWGTIGLSSEVEVLRVHPRRAAYDVDLFGITGTAVREHDIGKLYQLLECDTRDGQGPGMRDLVLFFPALARRVLLDGRDVELRFGLGEGWNDRQEGESKRTGVHGGVLKIAERTI
jgi:hypothetical protein